jgi:hypothetical protein
MGIIRLLTLALTMTGFGSALFAQSGTASTKIIPVDYQGWTNSYFMSNGKVEAIVVPAIARVMQFRMTGDDTGVFWSNSDLFGQHPGAKPEAKRDEWENFGGDKTWPAPQEDWPKMIGRGWPPPSAFDAKPMEARIEGDELVMTSKPDADYGIEIVRRVALKAEADVMTITTEYRKVSGNPVKVAVWVITQMRDPQQIFGLLPEKPLFPSGYKQLMGPAPKDLQLDGRLLSLTRDPKEEINIGTDSSSLLWVGADYIVRIDSERTAGDYPSGGCSAFLYTNPDRAPYVELETTGPVQTMKIGDTIQRTNTYTIVHRGNQDAVTEAKIMLGVR